MVAILLQAKIGQGVPAYAQKTAQSRKKAL